VNTISGSLLGTPSDGRWSQNGDDRRGSDGSEGNGLVKEEFGVKVEYGGSTPASGMPRGRMAGVARANVVGERNREEDEYTSLELGVVRYTDDSESKQTELVSDRVASR
jgi:hypothetical protein